MLAGGVVVCLLVTVCCCLYHAAERIRRESRKKKKKKEAEEMSYSGPGRGGPDSWHIWPAVVGGVVVDKLLVAGGSEWVDVLRRLAEVV